MDAKHKAYTVYATGDTVVEKEHAAEVMKELENFNGIYCADIEMDGLVLIEKVDD